jgi:threonine dehydrogenase-like Zn-dependent dehydrogenase
LRTSAGDVRIETVPDARLVEPTDAVVRVTRAAICGSDLWPYKSMPSSNTGRRMGHEFIGVVESAGSDVRTVKVGQLAIAPFLIPDGTCVFCRQGLQTSCLRGGRWGGDVGRVGVPQADSIPVAPTFWNNVSVAGGPAPARAYIPDLLPDVLEGRIEPGRVFDRVVSLDEVPDGYRAMNDREVIRARLDRG